MVYLPPGTQIQGKHENTFPDKKAQRIPDHRFEPGVRDAIELSGKSRKKNGERSYGKSPSWRCLLFSRSFGGHMVPNDIALDFRDFPDE